MRPSRGSVLADLRSGIAPGLRPPAPGGA
jgi:hypothetical protein